MNTIQSPTENLSVRMPRKMKKQIDEIASKLDRSRNWVITEAIEQYLEIQRWQIQRIRARFAIARDPETPVSSHDQTMNRLEKRLKKTLGV